MKLHKYKHSKCLDINTFDFTPYGRELTREESYFVNGGRTVEDTHTVQSGDTLGTLVYDYNQEHGTHLTVNEVAANNGIENPDLIYVGQTINFGNSDENEVADDEVKTDMPSDNLTPETVSQQQDISPKTDIGTKPLSDYPSSNGDDYQINDANTNSQIIYDSKKQNRILADLDDPDSLRAAAELLSDPYLGYTVTAYGNSSGDIRVFKNYKEIFEYIMDSSDNLLSKEADVKKFLITIAQNPEDYTISVYQRSAIIPTKRYNFNTHSLFVITQKSTGSIYTLSFNGNRKYKFFSKGAWGLNTQTDIKSYDSYINGDNDYRMELLYNSENIDIQSTCSNIVQSINSNKTYWALDHLLDFTSEENCNTALFNTVSLTSNEN